MFITTNAASDKFMVAILALHFPPMQSVSLVNVYEDESAFVALHLQLTMAANEDQ